MNAEAQHSSFERPWTTEEAADYLQIHPRTITRMAKTGQIPGFRIGSHWRFRKIDLDEWMNTEVSSRRSSLSASTGK